jgi:hypothetical protein
VNRFGSFFYGSILGVFILAMIPRAGALGAFVGLIAGMSAVAMVNFGLPTYFVKWHAYAPKIAFLWHNVIGAVTVVVVGMLVSQFRPRAVVPTLPGVSDSRATALHP